MYFPYIRAKQYDLAAIFEVKEAVYKSESVIPIIEPIGTIKKIQYARLSEKNIPFILVINPMVGDLASVTPNENIINTLVNDAFKDYKNYWLGYIIQPKTTLKQVEEFIKRFPKNPHVYIHFHQFKDAPALATVLASDAQIQYNAFIDGLVGNAYVNHFLKTAPDILIKDGFKKRRRNEDYPTEDFFYDLHRLYASDYNYQGFGDFTVIGSQYDPGGGPAYVVAIHLTDKDEDDDLVVKHFKSDILVPPSSVDPGGKFSQALRKLKRHVDASPHLNTSGVDEFKELHRTGHFPGLGTVKKLSIIHHIEYVHSFL